MMLKHRSGRGVYYDGDFRGRLNNGMEEREALRKGWRPAYGSGFEKDGIVCATPEMALNVEGWLERKES